MRRGARKTVENERTEFIVARVAPLSGADGAAHGPYPQHHPQLLEYEN